MNLKVLAVCFIGLLAGCSNTPPEAPKVEKQHPSWPDSLASYKAKWEVKIIDGQAWVGMPFERSQELRVWMNDFSRYVQDSVGMICYYRVELKEARCEKYKYSTLENK